MRDFGKVQSKGSASQYIEGRQAPMGDIEPIVMIVARCGAMSSTRIGQSKKKSWLCGLSLSAWFVRCQPEVTGIMLSEFWKVFELYEGAWH